MNTSWTLPVETVFNETTMEDDYILTFPEDLIKKLGWSPSIKLNDGLKKTYEWFLNQKTIRY